MNRNCYQLQTFDDDSWDSSTESTEELFNGFGGFGGGTDDEEDIYIVKSQENVVEIYIVVFLKKVFHCFTTGELHFCPFHNFKVLFDLRKLNHIIIIYNYKVPILSCMKAEFINCATTFWSSANVNLAKASSNSSHSARATSSSCTVISSSNLHCKGEKNAHDYGEATVTLSPYHNYTNNNNRL